MRSLRETEIVRSALVNPTTLASLNLKDWDLLIRQARAAGVLGKIHSLLDQASLLGQVPSRPRNHLESALRLATSQARLIRWETYSIERALAEVQTEIVLLKGAAYVLAELPIAEGRLQSDVDILVPKAKLSEVEASLLEHGWRSMKLDPYDQRYYRRWSHELPPFYHGERETVLDVHHNILPETGRLRPSAEKLLQSAEPIPGTTLKRLCPADTLLHVSAHMFQDGSLMQGLRELVDIDGLIRSFNSRPEFWNQLRQHAVELDLCRPMFYALRYSGLLLGTPVPERVKSVAWAWRPPRAVLGLMDLAVFRSLLPDHPSTATVGTSLARWCLYVRSHWLRLPPWLLVRHLTHQGFRRVLPSPTDQSI